MNLSPRARELYDQVSGDTTAKGAIKKLAKVVKTDHGLALELWGTGELHTRMLAVLIMDRKLLDQALLDTLCEDLLIHEPDQQTRAMEWLMANQLMKSAGGLRLIGSWEHSAVALQRRTFWYHQARLRWTGKAPPDNTEYLLDALDARLADEEPAVQWAMNFLAAWVGIYQPEHRERCVALGERLGLYRDQVVPKNCVPNYLPEFIRIQSAKVGT